MDFSRRVSPSLLPERMDGPCSYKEFRDALRGIEWCNRWLLGYRPTLAWLERIRGSAPLRILDVGSGYGDLLRRIEWWAEEHSVAVELTGIDLNPYAERAAREASAGLTIRWITGDIFDYKSEEPIDVIVCSLMMHHLEDDEVIRLLRWMDANARVGWFVNDLERSRNSYKWFKLLARVARLHPFVRHDGPVSIRRAFVQGDWGRLLEGADIRGASVEAMRPGRLCVGKVR